MEKVLVPKDVAKALDENFKLLEFKTEQNRILSFMALPFSKTGGANEVLEKFALKYPEKYMKAVLNGYEPHIDSATEIANVIELWLNKPYEGGERNDIERLANLITKHFQH